MRLACASGDLVCDTNAESGPNFGCGTPSSCGSLDPVNNYMDYSDDACMNQFTPDQARRMRCTLEFYRSELPEIGPGVLTNLALDTAPTPTVGSSGLSVSLPKKGRTRRRSQLPRSRLLRRWRHQQRSVGFQRTHCTMDWQYRPLPCIDPYVVCRGL